MLGRARAVGLAGRLQLAVASPEDLFLLKGVTGRSGDLEDMAFLARMNLDWNAIASEVEAQPESWRWLGQFHASLSDLETEYEVLSPLKERYAREAEAITGVAALLPLLDRGPMRRGDIIEALETEDMGFVEAVIIKAVDIGAAEYGRGRLRKTTGRPASGDGHKGRG